MGGEQLCPWLAALPAYALGALDAAEGRALAAHLGDGCEQCGLELVRLGRDVEDLALASPPVAPPPDTREWLLAHTRPARWWARRATWGVAAGVLLVVAAAASVGAVVLRGRLLRVEAERDRVAWRLTASERGREAAERRGDQLQQALAVLGGERLDQVQLAGAGGVDGGAGASGRAIFDPRRRRALFAAASLPPLAADRSYQLWVVAGGEPLAAGTFQPLADGSAGLLVEALPAAESITAWAVSVEPRGGSRQPSGPILLSGSASGR